MSWLNNEIGIMKGNVSCMHGEINNLEKSIARLL